MTNSTTSNRLLLETAVGAALQAWRAIHQFYKSSDLAIFQKEDGPATQADRTADKLITNIIHKADPEAGFLTEESVDGTDRLDCDRVWIIDPIDGTTEFIKGTGDFAIHIAAVEREKSDDGKSSVWKPVVGVVFMPATGELFFAERDQGAWMKAFDTALVINNTFDPESPENLVGAKQQFVKQTDILTESTVISSRTDTDRLMKAFEALQCGTVLRRGSLGVKVMEVVRGRADFYLHSEIHICKEWDLCAPQIILEEAGGRVTQLAKKSVTYNHPGTPSMHGVVASNGKLQDEICDVLDGVI